MYRTFDAECLSYNEVARRLDAAGYPTPTGDGWRSDAVLHMLKNYRYAGGLSIGDKPKGAFFHARGGKEVPAGQDGGPEPTVKWGTHEGIVTS
jgi:hypothetical protein